MESRHTPLPGDDQPVEKRAPGPKLSVLCDAETERCKHCQFFQPTAGESHESAQRFSGDRHGGR